MSGAWGITDVGAVRQQNQDSYRILTKESGACIGVVCDGMGGAQAGNVASSLAVDAFCQAMVREDARWAEEADDVLVEAARMANELVYFKSCVDESCAGMGTTLVAALVTGTTAYILNIGDSRAYHIKPDGIARVTRDHSVVEDLVCRGKLTEQQARNHPQKNLITKALGSQERVAPDLYQVPVAAGEWLLLCSDGLSNLVEEQELLYEVVHGGPAESCCPRLLELALSRGAPDNVTVVLLAL